MLGARPNKLDWVQALRGIAALMVVICHTRDNLQGTPLENFATTFMLPGAMGVDLFFLVSGFIMVYTTRNSDGSALYTLDFMAKRVARVWPVSAVLALTFKTREPRVPKMLVWLGSISFSLYLVHVTVLIVLQALIATIGYGQWIKTPAFVVFFVLVSLLVAELSRRLLENGLSGTVRSMFVRLVHSVWSGAATVTGHKNSV